MLIKKEEKGVPKILWAPWRIEYILNAQNQDGCIFCELPKQSSDRQNLIVYRGKKIYVIMNRFPYNNGHLMIVPFQHTCDMAVLSNEEKIEMMDLLQYSQYVLKEVLHPQGFNIGMNIGRLAGAGIDCHIHFHLVPRWGGDTNFMPIVGHTKVISEGLEETWMKLHSVFEKQMNK